MPYKIDNYQPVMTNMPTDIYAEFGTAQAMATWAVMTNVQFMKEFYLMTCCLGGTALIWDDNQLRFITSDGQMNTVLVAIVASDS